MINTKHKSLRLPVDLEGRLNVTRALVEKVSGVTITEAALLIAVIELGLPEYNKLLGKQKGKRCSIHT